jgi:CheY-like chemotaxis protein
MTADSATPAHEPQRRARLRAEHHRSYPANYVGQWFRVVKRYDPDVAVTPGDIWLDLPGGVQRVQAAHFEIAERAKQLILVVDDDPGIRQTLQVVLGNTGYDVLQARDGEEATRLWHESGPDLVITDIHMPKKSGLLFIQDLETYGSSTPIIAMTDGGPAGNFNLLRLAGLLGSVRTIAKPFTLDDMVKVVNQELGR